MLSKALLEESGGLARIPTVLLHVDVVGSVGSVQIDTLTDQRNQDAFRRLSRTVSAHGGLRMSYEDTVVVEFDLNSDAVFYDPRIPVPEPGPNSTFDDNICDFGLASLCRLE